jgi:hypothetical protein
MLATHGLFGRLPLRSERKDTPFTPVLLVERKAVLCAFAEYVVMRKFAIRLSVFI